MLDDEHPSAGFTLVEAMVALSIVSLCLALLVGFISLGQRLQARSDQQTRQAQELAALDDLLGNLLGQVVPVIASEAVSFAGSERELSFASLAPKPFAAAEPLRFRLTLDPERGLVLGWWRGKEEKTALLTEEAQGSFSYRSASHEWQSTWSSDPPSFVKLSLLRKGSTGPALDLVWSVRVLRPQSCALDSRQAWCNSRR